DGKEIDYDDPKFNQGVQHVVDLLAKAIGAKDWVAGDGSEDYDCDLEQTLLNILAAKGLYEKDDGTFASFPIRPADGKEAGEAVAWREVEMMRLIDLLRSQEGDEVTICCDNPDFNGQPNCAVICNGDWTGWEDRRFAADTVLDALSMAATEYQLPVPRDVIAESNGHHWVRRFHLTCCRDCGIVRRADDMNSPCKGVVHVGPRASPQ